MKISLTEKDYEELNKFHKKEIDHLIIQQDGHYYLIIHNTIQGFMRFNGKWYSSFQIETLIRQELELPIDRNINATICTCYGCTIKPISNNRCKIHAIFNNIKETIMTISHNSCYSRFCANFSIA